MVFDTSSPPASSASTDRVLSLDRMFKSSAIELPLSDERDLSQIEAAHRQEQPAKWKMVSKRRQSCTNDMYATAASRYHRYKPPSVLTPLSTAEETGPFFSSLNKCPSKYANDEVKSSSASITTRRSTTDCNNLLAMNRRANQEEQTNPQLLASVDEESRDSIWPPTGTKRERERGDVHVYFVPLDEHHLLAPTSRSPGESEGSLVRFYSDPSMTPCSSSSSVSSFNLHSNSTDHSLSSQYSSSNPFFAEIPNANQTFSSSSGYESNLPTSNSSINSISDHLFLSSPDSLIMPPPSSVPSASKHPLHSTDRNLVEQFIDLHLQKQSSFEHDVVYSPPSSFSSTSSSFLSQAPRSTPNSPVCCRKCAKNEDHQQLSSDTEDDSQSTTISTNLFPSKQQQQNKRPRSLPIAIQQPKGLPMGNSHQRDDEDDESDYSLQNSLPCHCSMITSRKKRFRTCELNHPAPNSTAPTSANGLFSENTLISTTTDKLHIDLKEIDEQNSNEQLTIKQQKNSLEHFIMSPTDKVKVQMKYLSNSSDRESETRSVSVRSRMMPSVSSLVLLCRMN